MDMSIFGKKLKSLANVLPKVDVLGPEIHYVPKKIKINNPLPDLKSVTAKVDNEGLQIVHLPKDVRVHKGTPKFDNLRTRIDNKGIDILRGQSGQCTPTQTPGDITYDVATIEHEIEEIGYIAEESDNNNDDENDNIEDVFYPDPKPLTPSLSPLNLDIHSRSPSRPPSSSSSSDTSLPPTPPSRTSFQRLFSPGSGREVSSNRTPNTPPKSSNITPQTPAESRQPTPRSRVPTPPEPTPSPKPRLVTPPDSPELILKVTTGPPAKVKTPVPPTPPPSKLIQASTENRSEV